MEDIVWMHHNRIDDPAAIGRLVSQLGSPIQRAEDVAGLVARQWYVERPTRFPRPQMLFDAFAALMVRASNSMTTYVLLSVPGDIALSVVRRLAVLRDLERDAKRWTSDPVRKLRGNEESERPAVVAIVGRQAWPSVLGHQYRHRGTTLIVATVSSTPNWLSQTVSSWNRSRPWEMSTVVSNLRRGNDALIFHSGEVDQHEFGLTFLGSPLAVGAIPLSSEAEMIRMS